MKPILSILEAADLLGIPAEISGKLRHRRALSRLQAIEKTSGVQIILSANGFGHGRRTFFVATDALREALPDAFRANLEFEKQIEKFLDEIADLKRKNHIVSAKAESLDHRVQDLERAMQRLTLRKTL